MKKKIAYISEHASPLSVLGGIDSGGQNVYVDKLTRALVPLGYEIDIFTRWDDRRLPQIIDCENGIRVIHIKAGPVQTIKKEKLLPYMKQFTKKMLQFMEDEKITYELIHANFWMSAYVAAEIKQRLHIPFVVTFHALGKIRRIYQGKADGFPNERFAIEKRIVKEADRIIAECPQDREDLIYYYHANQDIISIIPCGYDPNEFFPIDKRLARMNLGVDKDEKIILQLGRMVPRKGIDTVIVALGILLKKYHISAKLLVVGGDSDTADSKRTPEIGRLKKIAQNEGIENYVVFTGRKRREELKYYYNAADVFVSTPWYEPFGITPLEAMACGTPVIGSEVGGIKFSVQNGKTGLLVPPQKPEVLAKKLYELMSNEKLSKMFSENSKRRLHSFFTWSIIAKSMSALYEKIIYSQTIVYTEYEKQSAIITKNFESLITTVKETEMKLRIPIMDAVQIIVRSLSENGKILICGNGGSASDAQHFAAELVGYFQISQRKGLPVFSLTSDTSILTALGNDYSFEEIFSRQVEAYGETGDVFIGISTSGNSENVTNAFKKAREKNMICIGILGKNGGKTIRYCDIVLIVPSFDTQRIQELHTHIIHTMCELVEKQLFKTESIEETSVPSALVGIKNGRARHTQCVYHTEENKEE